MKLIEAMRRMKALLTELLTKKAILSSEVSRCTETVIKAAEVQKEATRRRLRIRNIFTQVT